MSTVVYRLTSAGLVGLGAVLLLAPVHVTAEPSATSPAVLVSLVTQPAGKPYVGDTVTIEAVIQAATDAKLECQFLVDDVVIQSWSQTSSCQLILGERHVGFHQLEVQVRRDRQRIGHATDTIYVLHPPIEPPDSHEAETSR